MKRMIMLGAVVASLMYLGAATPAEASHRGRGGFGFSLNLGGPGYYGYGGRGYYSGYRGYYGPRYGGYYGSPNYYRPYVAPRVYAPGYYVPRSYGYGGCYY
ncbi:MAG: hypothetical protein KDA65_01965 [Planctomycetaceae bacterium]|nr:hypothetical protein [Planctomycetaceae bacterium]